jgi:hypothetical protein
MPQFLTDEQGNATYAILPIEEYNHLVGIANDSEWECDQQTLQAIERGLKDAQEGNFVPHQQVMEKAKAILEKYLN